jgi:hypothetical protein
MRNKNKIFRARGKAYKNPPTNGQSLRKVRTNSRKIHKVFEAPHFHKEKENTTNIMQHKKQ